MTGNEIDLLFDILDKIKKGEIRKWIEKDEISRSGVKKR